MRWHLHSRASALVVPVATAVVFLLGGCGEDGNAGPTGPSSSSSGAGGSGGSGGAGGGGSECAPLPADFPADVPIETTGQFRSVSQFPLVGFAARRVQVYLPKGYDGARRYPVVYFTDGAWVFTGGYYTHLAMESLVADGVIEPHILVAIDQTDERTFELTPVEDPTDPEPTGGGDDFAGQIVERVKPFVDANFQTRCGREDTTIAGFSLGGLMCWHMLLRDPDVFGKGICESPSVWFSHKDLLDRFARYQGPMPLRVWMDVGTKEVMTIEELQAWPPDAQLHEHGHAIVEMRDLAVEKGMILGESLGYHEQINGAHTQSNLSLRMPGALAFALSDTSLVGGTITGHAFDLWLDQIAAPPYDNPYAMIAAVSFETRYEDPFVLTVPNALVELASSDETVATLDADGVIHSVAPGTATITASFSGLDDSAIIEVVPPP
jgi:predicted alpha/beta superfamily hydrolase